MKPTAWLVRRLGRRGPTYSIRWTDRMGKCRSRSLGADKAEGGDGEDQDMTSW